MTRAGCGGDARQISGIRDGMPQTSIKLCVDCQNKPRGDPRQDVLEERMKILACGDLGPECSYEARGATEEEVLSQIVVHAVVAHNLDKLPDEIIAKARMLIREEVT